MDSSEVSSSDPYLSTDAPLMPLEEDKLQKQKEAAAVNMVPRRSNSNGRKFLGVRQRPSGRWVAEIKDSSQKLRLWLGTFDRPEDAALAYDSAARLLRGKNAKTNFSCAPEFSKKNTHHEGTGCSFLGKNPRAYHLLQHAVMKNRAVYSSLCSTILPWKNQSMMRDQQDYDTLVEETVVCSSSSDEGGSGCSELSFGSSKVYSSVIVAPSFSSSLCQTREYDEGNFEKTYF